jgi:plasmid rolling circle replication initiator protein Rep
MVVEDWNGEAFVLADRPPKIGEQLFDINDQCRIRPWRPRREQALAVGAAYQKAFEEVGDCELGDIARRMDRCGSFLEFVCADHPINGRARKLRAAEFCHCRLCPMCNWRRSRKLGTELGQVIEYLNEHERGLQTAMLTLTVKNVAMGELNATLHQMMLGFNRLMKRRRLQQSIVHWYRTLEVTVKKGMAHPHFHVLVFFNPHYHRGSARYISQNEFARTWAECLGVSYLPVVDVRRSKGVNELVKYCTKPDDYMRKASAGWIADPGIVQDLHYALKNRRLVGWSQGLIAIRHKLDC